MTRPPVLATLIVTAAVLTMIALGVWQLRRAEWKGQLISEMRAAQQLPVLNLDGYVRSGAAHRQRDPPIAFRRVRITCFAGRRAQPDVRAGRNRLTGAGGWSYFIPCFWDERYTWLERLHVNVGWAQRPDVRLVPHLGGHLDGRTVEGVIGMVAGAERIILTSDRPLPPLAPSASPDIGDIPNNHLFYALQWFFFAGAAVVIYLLALRSRRRGLPPAP